MSPLERALTAADDVTLAIVLRMIGKETLALHIAKTLADSMGEKVDSKVVAEVFGIEIESAQRKIAHADIFK